MDLLPPGRLFAPDSRRGGYLSVHSSLPSEIKSYIIIAISVSSINTIMSGVLSGPGSREPDRLFIGYIVCTILPIPFVVLRFWARRLTKISLQANDWLALAALFPTIGVGICNCLGVTNSGLGSPPSKLNPEILLYGLEITFSVDILWITAVFLVRLSVLHFYKIVFFTHRNTVYILYIVAGLCVCHWVGGILSFCLICHPFSAFFNPEKGHCYNSFLLDLWLAIGSLLLDAIVVAIPQPIIWRLQLSNSRKVMLAGIFGLGLLIIIFSTVRCHAIAEVRISHLTSTIVFNTYMTLLEPALGIVNVCLPVLLPVVHRIAASGFFSYVKMLLSSMDSRSSQRMKARRTSRNRAQDETESMKSGSRPDSNNLRDTEDGFSVEVQQFPKSSRTELCRL